MNSKIFTSLIIISSIIMIAIAGLISEPKTATTEIVKKGADEAPVFTKERYKYFWERMHDPSTGDVPTHIKSAELNFVSQRWSLDFSQMKGYDNNLLANDTWQRRGPWEIGGRTRALGLDIRNEDIIVAGGVSGGMWKSSDAGETWMKTSKPSDLQSVTCLKQDIRKGKEDNWYYGTGEYYGNSASIYGDGIYKSTDNGSTWSVLPNTFKGTPHSWDQAFDFVWNLVVNPNAPLDKDEILVATSRFGILKSSDGGDTWYSTLGASANAAFTDLAVTSEGVYYATLSSDGANDKGIFRSEDGVNWVNITPPNFPKEYTRIAIGIAPSDESQVYFVGVTPNSGLLTRNSTGDSLWHSLWKYTYYSTDGDIVKGNWENRSLNLPKPEPTRGQMNAQGSYNLVIKVKPDDPNVVFLGAVAVYRSNSGFKVKDDWAWIGGTCPDDNCDYDYRYTNHHADNHEILFSNTNSNILYTGSDGGIHKTLDNMSDNVEWISLNNGYFTTQFYAIAIDHGKNLSRQIIGGLQDNGTLLTRSPNMEADKWTEPLRADGFHCLIPDDAPYYYASQNSSYQPKIKIFRIVQDENGVNQISTRIDPVGGADFIWNTPFELDPNDNNIMYLAGGKMVWRNNNLSEIPFETTNDSTNINWDSLSHSRIDYLSDGERITAISVSKNPANIVYYGTSVGNVYRIDGANVGNPKPKLVSKQNMPKGYISSIAIDPDNADEVIVSLSNYGILSIFYSTDAGDEWVSISGNLEERPNGTGAGPGVNWINILKVDETKVYFAGTTAGLFSTTFLYGNGTAWQMEGAESIGNVVIDMIDSRDEDKYVVVGTHGAGVYDGFYIELPARPDAVKLSEPKSGTKYIESILDLSWEPAQNGGFYDIEIAKDPNFIEIVYSERGLANTQSKWIGVEQGIITYYWRVRNVGAGGFSEYSEVWEFTSAIESPRIIYPPAGSDQVKTYFTFEWEKVESATEYHLQVAQGYNINNAFLDTIVDINEFPIEDLEKNKRYVWRVAAIEDGHEGEFSEVYFFITRHPASVGASNRDVDISVYPNPAKDYCYINLNVGDNSSFQLTISDGVGRIVETKELYDISNNNMTIPIDLARYSSGLYNIVLVSGKTKIYKQIYVTK